jgi:NADH-quinone oxidoreductase subunit M
MVAYPPLLTIIIIIPVVGGLLALLTGHRPQVCRWVSLIVTIIEFLLIGSLLFLNLQPQVTPEGVWLLTEHFSWLGSIGAHYSLGLDGISLMLILLTAFVNVISVLISWEAITTKVGSFHFFLLFLEGILIGLFLATDLLLFYFFWELQLVPMFFLIGIWGHDKKIYASVKFVLFTFGSSLFMLIALLGLYVIHGQQTGDYTFSVHRLLHISMGFPVESWLYAAFVLAFAVKIPMLPVHTWLPDAHTEAPTAGSVILAGILLKTGFYAFFRFAVPLFPRAAEAYDVLIIILGLLGIFYAAWIALAQTDIKRLVAYSSIGHMGLMVVGLGIWNLMTLSGSFLQMINHGITTSALFVMVGMLDERIGSRNFANLGGFWQEMPVLSAFFLFFALASMGLPGLNNFVGEILILIGTFQSWPLVGALSFAGLIPGVIYILRMVQDSLFGPIVRPEQGLWDAKPREIAILILLALPVLFIGLHPDPILNLFKPSIDSMMQQITLIAPN